MPVEKSQEELQLMIECLKGARWRIEERRNNYICTALDKQCTTPACFWAVQYLKQWISSQLGKDVTLEWWLLTNKLSKFKELSNEECLEGRIKTRLAWIDHMISQLQEEIKSMHSNPS